MKFDTRIKNIEKKNVIQQCVRLKNVIHQSNFYTNLINIFWVVRMQFGLKDLYTIIKGSKHV